jgi:anti-anti-sigma factor
MNMTTKTRQASSVTIVDIGGRIILGEECTSLGKLVSDLLGKGHNKILLNLADVHRVDTAGLAYIMAGLTSARKHNGDVKLLNPAKELQDVLQIHAYFLSWTSASTRLPQSGLSPNLRAPRPRAANTVWR